jgi:hypothetical protein
MIYEFAGIDFRINFKDPASPAETDYLSRFRKNVDSTSPFTLSVVGPREIEQTSVIDLTGEHGQSVVMSAVGDELLLRQHYFQAVIAPGVGSATLMRTTGKLFPLQITLRASVASSLPKRCPHPLLGRTSPRSSPRIFRRVGGRKDDDRAEQSLSRALR